MEKTIYLAGGCFWGVEAYFKRVKGVLDTQVGYANGKDENATYTNLKNSLHAETVKVVIWFWSCFSWGISFTSF